MIFSRKRWALLCSASLCVGATVFSAEPRQGQNTVPATAPTVAIESSQTSLFAVDHAADDPVAELRKMIEQQREELTRQNTLIERLQTRSGQSDGGVNQAGYLNSAYETPTAPAFPSGNPSDVTTSWKNGFIFESKDKAFKLHVGGRTQVDAAWVEAEEDVQFGAGGIGAANDAVNFRRGRFAMEGLVWDSVEFNMEWDFINTFNAQPVAPGDPPVIANTPVPTDLWLGLVNVPVIGHLRIGNQKPPLSFEHMTSSRFLSFMERSLAFDSFIESGDNGFRPGILAFDNWDGDRGVWQFGLFKNNSGFVNNNAGIYGWNVGGGEYDATGRLTYLPWASDDNRRLLHLGLGVSHRGLDNDMVRFRSRDSIRNGPAALHNIIAQARLTGDQQTLLVPELVMNYESWTLQAEYQASWTYNATEIFPVPSPAPLGTVFFQGGYVEVLYFLTGEHRAYDRKQARFDRVTPHENFSWKTGCWGAWQLGARYSRLDLKDGGINGGVVDDFTAGVNWFLNPNTKVQWNYAIAFRDAAGNTSDGTIQEAGFRVAFDW